MILVTGATGYIGMHLVRRLSLEPGMRLRVLLRPGQTFPQVPGDAIIHTVSCELEDYASILQAMESAHTVYHLLGTDTRGRHAELDRIDIAGTRIVVEAALEAKVGRFLAVSRIGADRNSAYDLLRTKGEIEDIIKGSGLAYTILRSSLLFGQNDRFTENIAMLLKAFPAYLLPGEGEMILQPLWVEDLVTCLMMALQDIDLIDRTLSLGGPELLTFRRIVMRVMRASNIRRPLLNLPLLVHKGGAWFLDGLFVRWPFTEHWIELLLGSQTAELGNIERRFGFRPAALDVGLIDGYMAERRYLVAFLRYILSAP